MRHDEPSLLLKQTILPADKKLKKKEIATKEIEVELFGMLKSKSGKTQKK